MAQLADDFREPVVMHADCKIVDEPIRRAEAQPVPASAAVFHLAALPVAPVRSMRAAVRDRSRGRNAAAARSPDSCEGRPRSSEPLRRRSAGRPGAERRGPGDGRPVWS